ncbi:hypothetical protein COT94_00400 [Candidatus Falkowbacteria bacterium CG10_big_fil_rev_8_21_14_0_10_37_14]|uniref:Uncharacterized protein n=1 Tax=Candidatus Falkowbacteria bacterium CG10_big_fil_rev_8_21_14_0_10_37_14 TaxID=1974561 RepID=A0A2M6WUD5_9BACT|nr:hypothetical protein [Candidatus Falkowbacteria bacterium]PIT96409.1 MAG: hypothetical protein COT94_00400 [Candidatus Falkowbacteria bacterium CG10_big_fil_rev_8_21_14_0_10_37_14]
MTSQHKTLAAGAWFKLSLMEQLANIGSEVIRALNWRVKNNQEYSQMAFERVLELFDLTMADKKNNQRLKEIARTREVLVDSFGDNIYQSSDHQWRKYFLEFNYAAQNAKGL